MFCRHCGKEIEEEWNICPFCKARLKNTNNNDQKEQETYKEVKEEQMSINKVEHDTHQRERVQKVSFGEYVFLGLITCGIYSIYTMWHFTKGVNKVCEGDGKHSPNFIVVLLLSVVTLGIYNFYWYYTQGKRLYEISPKYQTYVKQNGMFYLLWMLLLIGVGNFVATYYLFQNYNNMAEKYNKNQYSNLPAQKQIISKKQKILLVVAIILHSLIASIRIFVFSSYLFMGTLYDMDEEILQEPVTEIQEEIGDEEISQEPVSEMQEGIENEENVDEGSSEITIGEYLDACIAVSTEELARNPQDYVGTDIIIEGTFTNIGGSIVCDLSRENIEINYDGEALDMNGNSVGNILSGDSGYVAGVFNGENDWGNLEMDAAVIILNNASGTNEETTENVNNAQGISGTYMDQETGMKLLLKQDGDNVSFQCYSDDGNLFAEGYDCPIRDTYIDGGQWFIAMNMDGSYGISSGIGEPWGKFVKKGELDNSWQEKGQETDSVINEEVKKQAIVNEAYHFVAGRTYNKTGYQTTIEFKETGEVVEKAYYEIYHTYSFSVKTASDGTYYTVVTIDEEVYTFEYFPAEDTIILTGTGGLSGKYKQI